MKTFKNSWIKLVAAGASCGLLILFTSWAWADTPPPVLAIQSLGSNQFVISITNAVPTATYQVQWRPVLNDPAYPWTLLTVGNIGQSNFTVDAGAYSAAFFLAIQGIDADGDSIPDWQDAAPFDSGIGILTVVIDSPLNGSTLN